MFESPKILLIAAVAVFVVVSLFRTFLPDKRKWWQLLLPIVVLLSAFIVDYSVQTDNEAIKETVYTTRKSIETRNLPMLRNTVSKDYKDERNGDFDSLMAAFTAHFREPFIRKITFRNLEITTDSTTATVKAVAICKFDDRSSFASDIAGVLFLGGNAKLKKVGDKWLITDVQIEKVNSKDVSSLKM